MNGILISGGSGFVGSVLSSISSDARYIIRNGQLNKFVDVFEIESFDAKTKWNGAFNGIRTIIHLAGIAHNKNVSVSDLDIVNNQGTLNFANQAVQAGVKRFVFVSSIGVNGVGTYDKPFNIYDKASPHNPYAISKYKAELGLKKLSVETGLEIVIVRAPLIYGPNAPGNFRALTSLINQFPFLPFGLTNNRRDFIAVQNLADLLITCANHPDAAGHTFLASDGETVSIKDFTNAIAKGLNKRLIQLPVPVCLMYLAARLVGKHAMAAQLLGNLQVDSSNAKEVLGWVPPYTMEQAMASLSENKK
ncbi:NAD-dependent epimerase/dehydratase family protein [Shewanella sp. 10N.286.52.B9]|uniref:NAD-dependent epimerase/dehydratase family protein n=1 Tax=Shewanella sp. 10N.286.52.B9 TaxID=1880837 RepID=UPI000C83ED3D|nr:NAD-dependent epimerase/dehydratase family protein [Shewanella sp. 10N.286.52.B9]PMG42161.1 UDP-glucose 4-epimerase [Shewanella sp. 10N.286.52.B9]